MFGFVPFGLEPFALPASTIISDYKYIGPSTRKQRYLGARPTDLGYYLGTKVGLFPN